MAGHNKPYCKRDHEMTGDNLAFSVRKDGTKHRYCRECNRFHTDKRNKLFRELLKQYKATRA